MGSDREKLKKLIAAGHPCISITTREEKDALEVIRNLALESKLNMLLWSAGKGLRNGLLRDVDTEKDTEHPAAALCKLVDTYNRQMCVMLDLAGHLSDKITLRCLRDAIEWATQTASTLILIDSLDELPQIIRAHSTPFALSLPDEGQLNEIIRTTLKEHHYKNPIDIGVSRKGYQAVIKNLRGLTVDKPVNSLLMRLPKTVALMMPISITFLPVRDNSSAVMACWNMWRLLLRWMILAE